MTHPHEEPRTESPEVEPPTSGAEITSDSGVGSGPTDALLKEFANELGGTVEPCFGPEQLVAGRFRIVRFIARGGMGEVYEAHDLRLGERVALKTIRPEVAESPTVLARFRREVRLARKVTHKNVCRLYDLEMHRTAGTERETAVLSMELLDGETLAEHLKRRGPLRENEALDFVRQIAAAIGAAHDAGVVHRDFKSANVMLVPTTERPTTLDEGGRLGSDAADLAHLRTANRRLVVTDFGLAHALVSGDSVTASAPWANAAPSTTMLTAGKAAGTPAYMAPEQVEGREATAAADIYALGVVMYEMLTGRLPFEGETPQLVMLQRLQRPAPSPRLLVAELDPRWEAAILRCLEREPGRRFGRVSELVAALAGEASSSPSRAAMDGSRWKPWATVPETLKLAGLAAVSIALLIAALPWFNRRPAATKLPAYRQLTFTGSAALSAISPDGSFVAYVADFDQAPKEQKLMVLDLASGQSLEIMRRGWFKNLQWSPDGAKIMAAVLEDGTLNALLVPRLGGSVRKLPAGVECWSPDGSLIAGVRQKNQIYFLKESTGEETSSLTMPFEFALFDWSSADNSLLVGTRGSPEHIAFYTIKPDGSRKIKVFEVPEAEFMGHIARSPRNTAIYYLRRAGATQELMKIAVDPETGTSEGEARVLLSGLQVDPYAQISIEGRRFLYTRQSRFSNLWLAVLEGSTDRPSFQTKQLTSGTSQVLRPSISPDGESVAFSMGDGSKSNIFTMPLEGGDMRQLTFLSSENSDPVWSPDGTKIAFGSTEGGVGKVWVVDTTGGAARPFVESRVTRDAVYPLAWAPGPDIIYHRPGNKNFHLLNPNTEKERAVFPDPVGYAYCPKYSPDGKNIVVYSGERDGNGLRVISLEDSSQLDLHVEGCPIRWSAGQDWIYTAGFRPMAETENELIRVRPTGGQPEAFVTLPWENTADVTIAPDEKRFVCTVTEKHTDIWMIENFDPDVR